MVSTTTSTTSTSTSTTSHVWIDIDTFKIEIDYVLTTTSSTSTSSTSTSSTSTSTTSTSTSTSSTTSTTLPCPREICLYVNWRDQITPECGWTRIGTQPYIDIEDYPINYIKSNVPEQWTCDYRFEDTVQTGYPINVDIQIFCKYEYLGDDTFEVWIFDGNTWNYVGNITPTVAMQWQTIDVTAVLDTFEKINNAKVKLKYKEM